MTPNKFSLNVLYNLIGGGLPLIVAFIMLPLIIELFGKERFGYISLFWALIGSFSLFDLGISRALTHYEAKNFGQPQRDGEPTSSLPLLLLACLMGIIGGISLHLVVPIYVNSSSVYSAELGAELHSALIWIAVAIPITTLGSGTRGILEGRRKFLWINVVKLILGVISFVGLLGSSYFGKGLIGVAILMLIIRTAFLVLFSIPLLRTICWSKPIAASADYIPHLKFGGWVTVSNTLSPLLVYVDRLILGAISSPFALTAYSSAFELVSRLLFVPGSIANILFPELSSGSNGIKDLMHRAHFLLIILFVLPATILFAFSDHFLSWWLGSELAAATSSLLRILLLGTIFNGVAHIPFARLQAAGRPDVTAKAHLCEAVVYVPSMMFLAMHYGPIGAAGGWATRVIADSLILTYFSSRTEKVRCGA